MRACVRMLVLSGALLFVMQMAAWAQTPTVAVSPANKTVTMPQQFTIDVVVNNVTNCRAANFKISFDHNILTYNSTAKGSFLPDAFAPGALVVPGAQFDEITFDQSVLGTNAYSTSGTTPGILATFTFTAKAVGTTSITVVSATLKSPPNVLIPCTTVNGSVTVDPPLPIQLSSFAATAVTGSSVLLRWRTLSETDNLGFEVQRAVEPTGTFASIPGVFIEGHGTTIEPQEYSYTDVNTEGKSWYYRLKQIDRSGTFSYSEAIQATAATAVEEQQPVPTVYALEQNYPNPFNPETAIQFALPSESRVQLNVYTLLGQQVATLVDEVRQAGFHTVKFNAAGLGSGVYLYRLAAADRTILKKMVVVK